MFMFIFNFMFVDLSFAFGCAGMYALNVHDKYKTVCHLVHFFTYLFSFSSPSFPFHISTQCALFGLAQFHLNSTVDFLVLFLLFIMILLNACTATNVRRKNKYRQNLFFIHFETFGFHFAYMYGAVYTTLCRNHFIGRFFMT